MARPICVFGEQSIACQLPGIVTAYKHSPAAPESEDPKELAIKSYILSGKERECVYSGNLVAVDRKWTRCVRGFAGEAVADTLKFW